MPDVSVIIASRNRRETCANAVESALAQHGCETEIIVVDDGSSDDTADYIAARFPSVIVEKLRPGIGTSAARNVAARRARSTILAWIDDDAVYVEPDTLLNLIKAFDHPRVGAVTVPYVNHYDGVDVPTIVPAAPDDSHIWCTSAFIGVACAIHRDVYLGLGGCEPRLIHWQEEAEFCVRLYGAGYIVRIGPAGLIRHFIVASKYTARSQRLLSRNLIFAIWLNVPIAYAPLIMGSQLFRALREMLRNPRQSWATLSGTVWGIASSIKAWPTRKPISLRGYRAYMKVRKLRPVALSVVQDLLPTQRLFNGQTSSSP